MKSFVLILSFFLGLFSLQSQSIYEIQGQAATSPFLRQTVTTKGIVTAVYSVGYFIQDGDSAWCGLYIYDQTQFPVLGDSIELTGVVEEYYDMTELKAITAFTVLSSENTLPDPILIDTGDAQEKWESVLISVENATCTNTDLGYGEWQIDDGSGTLVVNDMGVSYTPILGVNYDITGPLDYSFSFFKIEPRTLEDIILDLPLYFTTNPFASEITKTSLEISWETNDLATSYLAYGLSPEYEMGQASTAASSLSHTLSLTDLQAGMVYYTKAFSVNTNNDTTPPVLGLYITQSESSGTMRNYFNHEKIEFTLKNAFTAHIVDTIISYIALAQQSLDITLYDLTNHAPQSDSSNYLLIEAINAAFDKGVAVRFITDDAPSNTALNSLNPSIPLVKGNTEGIMHNKFLIIDAGSIENSWVVSGSTNWTYNNLFMDYNNMVCIQDQSLAKAFLIEFNEMWGAEGLNPDPSTARFGSDKTDNTPHFFNINGVAVELYFSPSDKTTSKIVGAINRAQTSVDFAMMAFTEDKLGDAIVDAKNRGIATTGMIDYVEYSGSEFNKLISNDVDVYDYANLDGSSWPDGITLHHKFCVIDTQGEKPLLITGTHNWSASAESRNDENTLFIYDKSMAESFMEEYNMIKNILLNDVQDHGAISPLHIYPNPSQGNFMVTMNEDARYTLTLYNVLGQQLETQHVSGNTFPVSVQHKGMYIIHVSDGTHTYSQALVVE